jgi:catechol 2,3-dioxygenase-like lactoylglutathione lyase family enzyme
MTERVRAVGVNHVALEVDDIDAALEWWSRCFDFELGGRRRTMAWIDLGDQFAALSAPRSQPADDGRHFGLVVGLDKSDTALDELRAKGLAD